MQNSPASHQYYIEFRSNVQFGIRLLKVALLDGAGIVSNWTIQITNADPSHPFYVSADWGFNEKEEVKAIKIKIESEEVLLGVWNLHVDSCSSQSSMG
jgi:hypothetical protein